MLDTSEPQGAAPAPSPFGRADAPLDAPGARPDRRRGPGGRPAWAPTAVVGASIWLHAAALLGFAAAPELWAWLVGGVAANHAALGALGLCPRGRHLGPNLVRLPAACREQGLVALSFDDGPDPDVTPAVLDLLRQHGATASFFVVGERAASRPDLIAEMVRRGHSVENHTQTHPLLFACRGMGGMRREVMAAQATIRRTAGSDAAFFRAPAGARSPLLDPVLNRAGLRYTSWTRRGFDTVRRDPDAVLDRITAGLRAGDIVLLHDGSCARAHDGRATVLAVLPRLLHHLRTQGLRAVSLRDAMAAAPVRPVGPAHSPVS